MNKSVAHKETPSVQATTNADLRTECCGFSIIFWYQSDPGQRTVLRNHGCH